VVLRRHLAHWLSENTVAEAAHPLGVARGRLRQAHVLAAHPKTFTMFYYNIQLQPFLINKKTKIIVSKEFFLIM